MKEKSEPRRQNAHPCIIANQASLAGRLRPVLEFLLSGFC